MPSTGGTMVRGGWLRLMVAVVVVLVALTVPDGPSFDRAGAWS
jgi:hypothetical protein